MLPSDLAARYGLALTPLPGGVANSAYALGGELILRIPRSEEFATDLAREAVVIPVAVGAGVLTPSIVECDGSFMVLRRVPGVDLAQLGGAEAQDGPWQSVGEELAKLHRVTTVDGLVPPGPDTDPRELVEELAVEGWLDASAARWLSGWFGRLSALCPSEARPVLIHGDIAPQNLMVDPATGVLTGIVDWGDAALGDPATDFAKLPLRAAVPALSDYLADSSDDARPSDDAVEEWCARILKVHLHWGLARLRGPEPAPAARHWTAPPAGRLLGLLRFFASDPPAPWNRLTWPA